MFYDAVPDPYCYPGTTVLKNRLQLQTQAELDAFEHDMTAQRFDEPLPSGRLSVAHYRAIHKHLFQDVYPWAGRYRTVRISKGGSMFCYPEHIPSEMQRLFEGLARQHFLAGLPGPLFARTAAHFMADLNAIHPFREGNGRTQLVFMTLLADKAGHPLKLDRLAPEVFLEAVVASFQGQEAPLADVLAVLTA
ncbi:Fic/DOC family protein [Pleomorphomonas oryzae]|uniref:Fic/DOC family protein n=1 Tax=Pleomorphomonas oryzae TaxID=261934 RepID=UPI00041B94D6|nr:Fic family protein [Pleomorphomonas oryzae]